MQPKKPNHQLNFLCPDLLDQLNPENHLLKLAKIIPWQTFEDSFLPQYGVLGRPGKPVRLMVGLLILKHLENLSDERVVEEWEPTLVLPGFLRSKTIHLETAL